MNKYSNHSLFDFSKALPWRISGLRSSLLLCMLILVPFFRSTPAQGQAAGQQSQSQNTSGQLMFFPSDDFRLSVGDLISVRAFSIIEYNSMVRIGGDGTVKLPYIGRISLENLTVSDAQTLIAERLRTGGFYQNPEVIIQVSESLNGAVILSGEVKGTVPVSGQRSLIEVLAAAGGLPASASHTVEIIRAGLTQPIIVDLGADLANSDGASVKLQPRDIVLISRASSIYTLGAFRSQGAVPLDQSKPVTLLQLVAQSGGVGYEGRYDDLRIIRTIGNERKFVQLDIKKVINGKAPDPVLQPNDIVYLPTNTVKAALKSLGIGGVLGLVTLAYSLRSY